VFFASSPSAGRQEIEDLRRSMGLDRPIPVQLVRYLGEVATGNLGRSLTTGQPVVADIGRRLPASLELTFTALLIALTLAVVAQVWIWIYQPDIGLLNTVLRAVGASALANAWLGDPTTALPAVILAWCWQQTALSLVLYLAALTTIPAGLMEAAAIDGASGRAAFRYVVLPLLRPATTVVVALAVIGVLKGFDIVYLLTGGGPVHASDNLAMFMFNETFRKYQLGYGAAISSILFGLALAVVVMYFRQARAAERIYG